MAIDTASRTAAEVKQLDLAHVLHPMSPFLRDTESAALIFAEANGLRLVDVDGHEYLDGIAGLFNVNVGYGRRELAQASATALETLSCSPLFFNRGNVPAAELAAKLATLTPGDIDRFVFTLGGSDAVDTAIKIARYANHITGRPSKSKVIGRWDSYHGMTLGSTAATGEKRYWEGIGPLVPGFVHIPQPTGDRDPEILEQAILREGPDTVAAFIAEPVSLPSVLTLPDKDYWPAIRDICARHDVTLVADEVITGFGRTGKPFAMMHWGVTPDLLVMSKGITSGYLPLGAVGLSEVLFQRLATPGDDLRHGFTASGHPAACAVALANLEILEREGLVANASELGKYLHDKLRDVASKHAAIVEVRSFGMLAAIDLARRSGTETRADAEAAAARLQRLKAALRVERLLCRDYQPCSIVLGPCLSATRDDIDEIVLRFERAVAAAAE